MLNPWRAQYSASSGTRAIVPSSFITSQITPAGFSPASRARSTAASVCPARSSTPPARLFSGNTCPGCTRSEGLLSGSIATWMVWARSCAEIPVVTPSRASTETVKGVSNGDSFLADIRSSCSSSQRSAVNERQISPRPSLAMKLTASGVANCAAIVRSPSFSRSSSSHTTTILPWRMSSIACSLVAKPVAASGVLMGKPRYSSTRRSCACGHQSLDVLGEDVHLDVHGRARLELAEVGAFERLGDQRHREAALVERTDGEAHAVDGNRALLDEIAGELRLELDLEHPREALLAQRADAAGAVDVTLDDMPAKAVVGA